MQKKQDEIDIGELKNRVFEEDEVEKISMIQNRFRGHL
jgi:hypothetical protein